MSEGDLSSKHQNDIMQSKKSKSNSGKIEMNNEKDLQLQSSNDTENKIKSYSNYRKNAAISRLKELESKLQVKGSITQESKNTKTNRIKKPTNSPKGSESLKADNTEFFKRPNTIRLKVEEDHDKIELIKEFIKNAPRDSVARIASFGNNIYHIGFKDTQLISKFVMDGFLFKGKRIQPTLFDDTFNIVTIKDLPINIEPKEITRLLSKYGKVLCYKMLKYDDDDISWLETGEMKVGLFVHKAVPESFCIKSMRIKISCRQLVRVCTSCGKECFASFLEEDEESEDEVPDESNCNSNSENVNKESKEPVNNGHITGCWTKDGNKSSTHQFNETQISEVNGQKGDQNGDNCEKGRTEENENETVDASISREKSNQIAIQEESVREYSDDDDCSVENNEVNSDDDNEGETENADNEMALPDEDNEGKSSNDADNELGSSSNEDNEVEICDDGLSNDENETGSEVEAADDFAVENSERDDSGLKSEEADDGDDSGYYLENNNHQGECNGKEATNKKCDKPKKAIESMEAKMEDHLRSTRAKTFMDTMSTSERRSEFDCERVMVTLMDKIKDNLSSELNRSVNRIMLAKAMDKYNLWDKWYKIVEERKTVNWDSCYWAISEEYRRLVLS